MPRVKGYKSDTELIGENINALIHDRIRRKGWDVKHFAKLRGISLSKMYHDLRYPMRMQVHELLEIAGKLGIPYEELLKTGLL